MRTELDTQITINLRPIRYAYFIEQESFASFREAIRCATTQWGGIHSLIVPVTQDFHFSGFFAHLTHSQQPDDFICLLEKDNYEHTDLSALRKNVADVLPHRKIVIKWGRGFFSQDRSCHPLNIVAPNDDRRVLHNWQTFNSPQDSAIVAAVFGEIPSDQIEVYRNYAGGQSLVADTRGSEFWSKQTSRDLFDSAINLTATGLRTRRVAGFGTSTYLDVIVSEQVSGLAAYWSLRAVKEACDFHSTTRRTFLIHPDTVQDRDSFERFLYYCRSIPPVPGHSSNVDLNFICDPPHLRGVIDEHAEQLKSIQKHEGTINSSISFGDKKPQRETDPVRTLVFTGGILSTPHLLSIGLGNAPCILASRLTVGRNNVLFTPPQQCEHYRGGGVVLEFESDAFTNFPKHDAVAALIAEHGWWSTAGVAARYNQISLSPSFLALNFPTDFEALSAYFESKGYMCRYSKPGRYAQALLGTLGRLSALAPLASPTAYRLMEKLSIGTTKKIAQRIAKACSSTDVETIVRALRDAEFLPDISRAGKSLDEIASHGLAKPSVLAALEALARLGLVRRGFRLRCPNCDSTDWFPIESASEYVTCSGCAHRFTLPVLDNDVELKCRYLLNSLLERAMDHDALPSLIAPFRAMTQPDAGATFPGIELLDKASQVVCEFDYVHVTDNQIHGGECKTGAVIEEKDIRTARIACECQFHAFSFCSLSNFSEDSRRMIEEYKAEITDNWPKPQIHILNADDLLKA